MSILLILKSLTHSSYIPTHVCLPSASEHPKFKTTALMQVQGEVCPIGVTNGTPRAKRVVSKRTYCPPTPLLDHQIISSSQTKQNIKWIMGETSCPANHRTVVSNDTAPLRVTSKCSASGRSSRLTCRHMSSCTHWTQTYFNQNLRTAGGLANTGRRSSSTSRMRKSQNFTNISKSLTKMVQVI